MSALFSADEGREKYKAGERRGGGNYPGPGTLQEVAFA